jgi:hypothetical protein
VGLTATATRAPPAETPDTANVCVNATELSVPETVSVSRYVFAVTGAVNDNTTVTVPFADTEVADGVAAENVRDPNDTANEEIVDAAWFVIVTVTMPVPLAETCPNATDVTGLPPTDSPTGAGTVPDSGTFSVNATPLTVPVITSVSAYGAGASGPANESASVGVSVVARLDGSDVVVILNGDDAPDPIAN